MTTIPLTKTETTLLKEAAERRGNFVPASAMKPAGTHRLVGRLIRDGLIEPVPDPAGGSAHRLTRAGYGAVGLAPPVSPGVAGPTAPSGSKRGLVIALLARGEGASLAELVAATGWLPHTTRAALSRLRSAGHMLLKNVRQDRGTVYRIQTDEPTPRYRRARLRPASADAAAI